MKLKRESIFILVAVVVSVSAVFVRRAEGADVKVKVTADQAVHASATPVDKLSLNALMKHPSVPNFDRLRPMSGEWVRCKAAAPQSKGSQQDRFSSTDSSHFTRVTGQYSDGDCKDRMAETRTSWVCEPSTNELLSCRLLKEETGSNGAWTLVKKSDDDLASSTLKLSLKPTVRKKGSRKLELRIKPDGADDAAETETILLSPRP